ncbi:MAG: sugar ABC transporter ATP-binding protein [Clostridia bacterium]|nr:sugar ABC transporter ATP-binding protein [Clostridia bacterium]
MSDILLEAAGIQKNFGSTRALRGVDFRLRRGEIHGLIGENGSGKYTLCSVLAGVYGADAGAMTLRGAPYAPSSMVDAQEKGVAMIVQEMGTISGIGIADNIFVGKESLFLRGGLVSRKRMLRAAEEALANIGAGDIDPRRMIDSLNFEDRKLVEVARAMYGEPEVLIVDETTTALSQRGRDIIYTLCRRMAEDGKAVIFISHDLDELMEVCSVLTVLRDGELIGTLEKAQMEPSLVKSMMVGRELDGDYYRSDHDAGHGEGIALRLENINDGKSVFDASLTLHEGEILGLGGLTDCGMHELGRIAFGIDRPVRGSVTLGNGVRVTQPAVAVKNRMGYVSKNRDQESLMITAPVVDNITLPSLRSLTRAGLLLHRSERALAREQQEALSIKCASVEQVVRYLSGGNKQKVVFGRWIGNRSRVIILDCPTRGVDIGVKQAMYQLIYRLKKEGCSILLISEELAELIGMCDRIVIMKNGRIQKEFPRSETLSEHDLIEYMV